MKKYINRNAIYIGLALMTFFVALEQLNMADRIELRFFNILILAAGMWLTLFRKADRGEKFGIQYLVGIKDAMRLTVIASLTFTALFLIYTNTMATDFVPGLIESRIPDFMTEFHMAGIIMIEGVVSGLILGFMMMQYFKYNWWSKEKMDYSSEVK